eukprot:1455587-Pleurochrysis_carterae.AAC.2
MPRGDVKRSAQRSVRAPPSHALLLGKPPAAYHVACSRCNAIWGVLWGGGHCRSLAREAGMAEPIPLPPHLRPQPLPPPPSPLPPPSLPFQPSPKVLLRGSPSS